MPIPIVMHSVKGMSWKKPESGGLFGRLVFGVMMCKSSRVYKRISPYLKEFKAGKILDVGMGSGTNAGMLLRKGYKVKGVDVADLSMYGDLKATIYDGKEIPYKDKHFDVGIIIHVLHHCQDPIGVLKEAMRVSRRIIFIEDTFRNKLEKMAVSACDSLGNFEFCDHKYLEVAEWEKQIKSLGWKVMAKEEWSETIPVNFFYGRYCMFVIEPD